MTYAIRVTQVLAADVLVEANSLEEAIKKVQDYDSEYGISPDEIVEVNTDIAPWAKTNGEVSEEQMVNHYWHLDLRENT